MAPPNIPLLVLLSLLLLPAVGNAAASAAAGGPAAADKGGAFNITEILGQYPEFKLFNFLLTKTRVAREINARRSVTVLAPDNAAVDWLLRRSARLPRIALVELMSVHVVLDYIDEAKLAALPRGQTTMLTTLFQTTGNARNRTGFLNVTAAARGGSGGAVFVSAAPGSLVSATFKKAVTAVPYNVSVLQISNFVVPPRVIIDKPQRAPPPPPKMRQMAIAPSPVPAPPLPVPTVSISDGDTVEAPGEAEAPAPTSSNAGRAAQVMSRWNRVAAAVVGAACMLGFL